MEYVYAALVLHESDREINESNLTAILEAAGVAVDESRVKALVAALEDVDIEEAIQSSAGAVAPTPGAGEATGGGETEAADAEEETAAEQADEDEDEDEDEGPSGEGLGELFG